ncbi:MAG TPA: phosphoenolpyruvate--protein phosphotransferase [Desulfobacteraceae bacterium]|nr:phosphoenolpyruvate--protein phosphotransferase [Desulfobacteraceae bacterium]
MTEHNDGGQKRLRGIAVSPGIIIGKAHLVDRSKVNIPYRYLIRDEQLDGEIERFRDALRTTEDQLITLKNRMPDQVKEHGFILDTCLMIVNDSMLTDSTIETISNDKINAEWALKKSLEKIRHNFSKIDDNYISSRISDVENVAEKILRNLSGEPLESLSGINERVIIVAHELSPADASELNVDKIMGFITDVGGRTSHTAIMAQAFEIPAVMGLESATYLVEDGDLLIVDGNSGEVIANPDESLVIQYQEKQLQYEEYQSSIATIGQLPAVTLDGYRIAVKANVEIIEEVKSVREYGAEGIGLFRTEFLYLRSKGLPGEEELFEDYKKVVEFIAPDPVTIRTLDLGGDKFSSETEISKEVNPALGLRAIRFCLTKPEIFRTQLRAILRASVFGRVKLMFPMISGLQEVLDAKKILDQVKHELDHNKIEYDRELSVGIMIEIPSAVAMAEVLAEHVDFFSIGTNDLIQYALAIDRINEHVAFMYQPFHPAILRMIQQVVNAAKNAGIGLSLCGEMAGDPLCVPILLSLGIKELSVNARVIPVIKKIIRSISMKEAYADFENVMKMGTANDVKSYISNHMNNLVSEGEGKGSLDA